MRWNFLKPKAVFMIFVIIAATFSISLAKPATAIETTLSCCEKTTSGQFCRTTTNDKCDTSFKTADFQPCEETSFCKLGCCISPDGSCSKSVSHANCVQHEGYVWTEKEACDMPECTKACCVLAESQCAFVTEKKCDNIMEPYPDLEKDFRSTNSELECVEICRASEKGCCVTEDNKCEYITRGMCAVPGINPTKGIGFYKGLHCSDDKLNSDREGSQKVNCECTKEAEKKCVDGEDDVYWFDSCGNQEGIVGGEGGVGDCDYTEGSLCGFDETTKTYKCKSTNCAAPTFKYGIISCQNSEHDLSLGGSRDNGESWCVYDGPAGDYMDRPGSRHYRHVCINGEEMVESCRDFREELCLQYPYSSSEPTAAACQHNEIYDTQLTIDVSTVTKGGKFWESSSELDQMCAEADVECTSTWVKISRYENFKCDPGEYGDEVNKQCPTQEFANKAAGWCRSSGDCGEDYNLVGKRGASGEYTTGGVASFLVDGEEGAPNKEGCLPRSLIGLDYSKQKCNWDTKEVELGIGDELLTEWEGQCGVEGGLRDLAALWEDIKGDVDEPGFDFPHGRFWGSLGLSIVAGYLLGLAVQGLAKTVVGEVAKKVVAKITRKVVEKAGQKSGEKLAEQGLLGAIMFWVAIIDIIYSIFAMTGSDIQTATTKSNCKPWQPPYGGSDCELCDKPVSEGGFMADISGKILGGYTCTEYKCKSLGAACDYISENDGSGRPTCYHDNPNDVTKPVIEKWPETLEVFYKGQDITTKYSVVGGGYGYQITPDLPAYAKLTFGIKTLGELAQCKYENKHTSSYEEMTGFFASYPYYDNWHNQTFNPEPETDYIFYARCVDPHANGRDAPEFVIKFSTQKGPDLTPPTIEGTSLENGAYIAADVNNTPLIVYVDEPANCRWSSTDKDYELMPIENSMICSSQKSFDLYTETFKCTVALPVNLGTNNYYFRCKDQPLAPDEGRNTMSQSHPFTLIGTNSLIITQVGPSGTLYVDDVVLQVNTGEGAQAGVAKCSTSEFGLFFKTDSTYHEQRQYNLSMGDYSYLVSCVDVAGNTANSTISFKIDVDNIPPSLVSVWADTANLYITMDEASSCEFKTETFTFGDGVKMSGDGSTSHAGSLTSEVKTYYVLCQDIYNNIGEEMKVSII